MKNIVPLGNNAIFLSISISETKVFPPDVGAEYIKFPIKKMVWIYIDDNYSKKEIDKREFVKGYNQL